MSRHFNGSSQYLQTLTTPVTGYPLTLSVWFRPDNLTNSGDLISIANASSAYNWFSLEARGDVTGDPVRARVSASATHKYAITSTGFSANVWNHAAGVFASSASVDAYLNAAGKGSLNPGTTPIGLSRIGYGRIADFSPSNYYAGRLAEAAIWDIALSLEELKALAAGVSPIRIRPGNLIEYRPLYGNVSPEPNYSKNNSTAVVSGATQADHAPVSQPFGFAKPLPSATAAGGSAITIQNLVADVISRPLAGTLQNPETIQNIAASAIASNLIGVIVNGVVITAEIASSIAGSIVGTIQNPETLSGIVSDAIADTLVGSIIIPSVTVSGLTATAITDILKGSITNPVLITGFAADAIAMSTLGNILGGQTVVGLTAGVICKTAIGQVLGAESLAPGISWRESDLINPLGDLLVGGDF